jgi:hypothetical protein
LGCCIGSVEPATNGGSKRRDNSHSSSQGHSLVKENLVVMVENDFAALIVVQPTRDQAECPVLLPACANG